MELLDIMLFFVIGYFLVAVSETLISSFLPLILSPLKIILSGEKYIYLCKVVGLIIYALLLTRFIDYTFEHYYYASILSRILFFVIIGSNIYFFFGDKLKNAGEANFQGSELSLQANFFLIESIFVHLVILYLFLATIFYVSTPFLNLNPIFDLIPQMKGLQYIALAIFFIIYVRYFFALILSSFFTIDSIQRMVRGRLKRF